MNKDIWANYNPSSRCLVSTKRHSMESKNSEVGEEEEEREEEGRERREEEKSEKGGVKRSIPSLGLRVLR